MIDQALRVRLSRRLVWRRRSAVRMTMTAPGAVAAPVMRLLIVASPSPEAHHAE